MSASSALAVINVGIKLLTLYTASQPALQKASQAIAKAITEGRTISDEELKGLLSDDQDALDELDKLIALKDL